MFKSQASLKSLPSSLKQVSSHSTNKSSKSSQVKSVAHLKQVKSSPDKGQVKSQYQTGTNIFLSHDLIHFSSEINFF